MSSGTAKMPLETAGNDTDCQPRSSAQRNAASSACRSLSSSSPSPKRGPTAWITPLNGSFPAVVTTALPVGIGPRLRTMRADSSCSAAPAAREMMPATPPPCVRWPLAALTIASTGSSSRLPRTTSKTRPGATSSWNSASCVVALSRRLLDFRFCPELPHQLFDLLLHQLLLDAWPDLGECRKLHLPHVVKLDDMEAVARAHRRLRVLAFLELHHDLRELRVEHARHVPVEVAAAVLGAVVLRILGRQLVELPALLELGDHAVRLLLGLEQDVARLVLLVAGLGLRAVVFLLHVVVRDRVLAHPVADVGADQDFLSRQVELALHLGGLRQPRALRFLRHDLPVDQLVAHHGTRLVVVRSPARGLLLHHQVHPRARHRHTVHGGDRPRRGSGLRGGLRRRLGAVFRLGLSEREGRRHEQGDCEDSNRHRLPFSSSGLCAVMASACTGSGMSSPRAWYTMR